MTANKDELRRQMNNAYIETKLNNIIEPMVKQMLQDQPSNHVRNTFLPIYLYSSLFHYS
jgi:hypothetical protein